MPKRINRIRGILRPLLATCSRNNAIHEISSAESKCIIFCRAERPTAGTEPPRRPYATFSAQSWHDGLKNTRDQQSTPIKGRLRLDSRSFPRWRITTKRVFRLRRRCFVIFKPFESRAHALSPLAPMFRDFQAISASSARSFARQRKQEVEMPRVVGEGTRGFAHNATSPKEGGRLAEGRPSLKSHFASQTKGNREPLDMNRRAANAFNART